MTIDEPTLPGVVANWDGARDDGHERLSALLGLARGTIVFAFVTMWDFLLEFCNFGAWESSGSQGLLPMDLTCSKLPEDHRNSTLVLASERGFEQRLEF